MQTSLFVAGSAALTALLMGLFAGPARADPVCGPMDPSRPESDIIGYKMGCPIFRDDKSKPQDKAPPVQRKPPDKDQRKSGSRQWFKSQDCAALNGFETAAKNSDIDTVEYSFFVVMEPDPAGGKHFTYTDPVAGTRSGTEAPLPRGIIVKAFLHNHPRSLSFQGFSPPDLREYRGFNAKHPDTAWYLRTPLGAVVKMTSEEDFPFGKDVSSEGCK